jgi:peptidoglycan/LPS O-acetylase OafA/YrhL
MTASPLIAYFGNTTLQDRLDAAGNRPSGFDYLRLGLATSIFLAHTMIASYGFVYALQVWSGPARPLLALLLPMFFALSGFLVAGSLERCLTVVSFVGLRVLRIMPALAVETVLSAVVLGPIFTDLALVNYFSDPEFRSYFWNLLGNVQFNLPGVFRNTPWPRVVNGQLWTLPYELYCYAAITALVLLGVWHRKRLFLPVLVLVNVGIFVWALRAGLHRGVTVTGTILVQSFLFGIAGHLYRARILWSGKIALAAAAAMLVCLSSPGGDFLAALPCAYLTVYLGLLQPKRIAALFRGDYSYGIFLYGFPIQQAVMATLGPQPWFVNFLIAFPITVVIAMFSWRFVERPALALRSKLHALESTAIKRLRFGAWSVLPLIGVPR